MRKIGKWAIALNLIAAALNLLAGCITTSRLAASVNFFAAGFCCCTAFGIFIDWAVKKGKI